jgi:hypothetical protein
MSWMFVVDVVVVIALAVVVSCGSFRLGVSGMCLVGYQKCFHLCTLLVDYYVTI